jgi:hypothetical protein
MYYVYQHRRNDTNAVFYVGKGKGYRCSQKTGRNIYWHRVASKHGFSVEKVITDLDEELSLLAEYELIDQYKRLNFALSNLADGGEGSSGYKFTPDQIETLSAAHVGKKHSAETKAKMSAAKKGKPPNNMGKVYTMKKPMPLELRLKLGEQRRGRIMSEESSCKKSLATKGRPLSQSNREKIKLAWADPEKRAKMSEKMKEIRAMKKLITPPVSPSNTPLPWSQA